MAHGDTEFMKTAIADLVRNGLDWSIVVGFHPGLVVIAFAGRKDGKIIAQDCPIPADQVDRIIEQLRDAKRQAERKRQ